MVYLEAEEKGAEAAYPATEGTVAVKGQVEAAETAVAVETVVASEQVMGSTHQAYPQATHQ